MVSQASFCGLVATEMKATQSRKRTELLHDIMEGRDYGQLKDLISDRSRWRQDSK